MDSILVKVERQKMYISSATDELVAGSKQFVKFKFELSKEWTGMLIFAQFRQNSTAYNQYLDSENCVFLPAEIKPGSCTLMLHGTSEDGTVVGTTNYLTLAVADSGMIADATSTDISQTLYEQLVQKVNELSILTSDEAVASMIEDAVAAEINTYLNAGTLANMTIIDGSITKPKLEASVQASLDKADTAMQPSDYDTRGFHTDVYDYAALKANEVKTEVDSVKNEIADAYTIEDAIYPSGEATFLNLKDTINGVLGLSRTYVSAALAEYKAFTIKIVEELPTAGDSQTFYLLPKESGRGYDKYWYITNEHNEHTWDMFGGTSTVVVTTLPDKGEPDIDYILEAGEGYLYYKYIDNVWKLVAGSLAKITTEPLSVEDGNEFTDYFVSTDNGETYSHYRFIDGEYKAVSSTSYTKDEIDSALAPVTASVTTLTETTSRLSDRVGTAETDILSLNSSLAGLQQEVRNIDVEGYTYEARYGTATLPNGEESDNVFTLVEVKDGVEEIKNQFVIAGGGGGSEATITTNLVVERVTESPVIATPTDKILLEFTYSSTDQDNELVDGYYTWKMGRTVLSSGVCAHGLNTFDMTEYCGVGTQKFTLTVVDNGGSTAVKSWTVQIVDVRLDSTFSDKITYPANAPVNFTYTPYGSVSKVVHFILDGVELEPVTTSTSGAMQSYPLPAQTHGAHLLECYITAMVNNKMIETQHIYKDIVWYDDTSDVPVISCIYRYDHYGIVNTRQYNSNNIPYCIFNPTTGSPTVTHAVDGDIVSTQTLTGTTNTWTYKTDVIGQRDLTISCGETSVLIKLDVAELGIDINPITANLAFDFNPNGLSNASENRLWSDANTGVTMSVSDNFDWLNGGYHLDEDGNQFFCVKAGTTATINYKLFERNAALYGSEFKIVFKTGNVKKADATFLSCMAGETPVGLQMDAHAAYYRTSATGAKPLYLPYSEGDVIEFEYNVTPLNTEQESATSVIMSYEDGVGFRPLIYDSTHRLYQYAIDAVPITIGSNDCDVYIYRMKAYTASLSDLDILTNFIADARDSDTMLDRYYRNQIYNENNALTPESLADACPNLKVIKIDCPFFTKDKKEIITAMKNSETGVTYPHTVECIHKGGDLALDNWKATNCAHSGQGTTSNEYGYAGRNLNIYMCFDGQYKNKNVTYDPEYITTLTMGDGTSYNDGTGKVTLTRNSVPNALFNIKVNIASSENANNALLAKRYNEFLPYTPVGNRRDNKSKTTMEFVNCVVFVRENHPDLSKHREFQDTDWHFYAIGNIGDSKDTDITRTNDPEDHNEFVIEIADNTLANSIFPTGVTDEDGKMVYPIAKSQWVPGNPAYDSLHNAWGDTYEFRYDHPDITDDEEAANIQVWNDFYEWVVTSTDEEFVSQLNDWTIGDAFLYMYLFTERYTMIDNRAKNTFWHYGKVYISQAEATEMGEEKASRFIINDAAAAIRNGYRFDAWDYDNDTALGINNSGEMTMPYGKEDIDYRTDGDPSSGFIFNAAESVFFRRIRNLMHTQLQNMYLNRESVGAWSASGLITEFDNWQNMFPEEVWRLDIERKYTRTYLGGTRRFLETMMNGRKRYHRRQWERDQEAYMGSKYIAAGTKADQIMFRCNTPQSAVVAPNYDLEIVPYTDMYVTVLYGNSPSPMQTRVKAGQTCNIENPLGNSMDDTAILIYSASKIQALNDLSGCYIHDNDFTKASKLQHLIIGNSTVGYRNNFLTELNIGNNVLLENLNVVNCPNLVGSINLNRCENLETIDAKGTSVTGVTFAPNGKIKNAYLPATVNTLYMKNLNYLTNLNVSYDSLESLTEENSIVDELAIVRDAVDTLQTLVLRGINWVLPDTTLLNRILAMNSSYLEGRVEISGSIRDQELTNYDNAWSDLEVVYNPQNLVTQYEVTYYNYDESTVLYSTFVDRGELPPDPYALGLIPKPQRPSDEQYIYDFGTTEDGAYIEGSGWVTLVNPVLSSQNIYATYSTTTREYTVTWYMRPGLPIKSVVVPYGTEVIYDGETPTNTAEEGSFVYNVFAGWDASTGYVREDINVYAIWDRAELPALGKDIKDMTPAEISAVVKTDNVSRYFEMKDYMDVTLGHDFNFTNVSSELLAENLYLDGQTAIDKNITLFGENDESFTLAIDFQFNDLTTQNTLVSCFEEDGSEGFRLRYNGAPNIQWGDTSCSFGYQRFRDMVVIRHRKGDNVLYVYASNGTTSQNSFDDLVFVTGITRSRSTRTNALLTLGAIRFIADGGHDDYGKGTIHWCKIWHDDLGDYNAKQLASWCREKIRMEFCGADVYRLAGGTSQRSKASFICNHLLGDRGHRAHLDSNNNNSNVGGWEGSLMRGFLNGKLYDAIPTVWKSLIKRVKINASAGNQSQEIIVSEDMLYLPCRSEMIIDNTSPYVSEGSHIEWFIDGQSRLKCRGYVIPEDASVFSAGTTEPTTIATNNVKKGDIWMRSSIGYIYITQEDIEQYGTVPKYTASVGGGWVECYPWWLRSPLFTSAAYFCSVYPSGAVNSYPSSNFYGVCPCFSI